MSTAQDTRRELPAGTALGEGRYTVGRLMARLPTGLLYKGAHPATQQLVWISEVFPEGLQRGPTLAAQIQPHQQKSWEQLIGFAQQQAQRLARIQHPGLATVEELLLENNTLYLIQKASTGQGLASRLEAGPLTGEEVLLMVRDLAQGLVPLHAAGLAYGWLPPAAVWLTAPAQAPQILGLPLLGAPGLRRWLTQAATPLEAPELRRGQPGPATDLFALAATTVISCFEPPLPPPGSPGWRALLQSLPPGLARATQISLHPNPNRRPFDAADYLQFLYHQPAANRSPAPVLRRNLIIAGLGVAGLAVIGLGGLALLRLRVNPSTARPRLPGRSLQLGSPVTQIALDPTGQRVLASLRLPGGGSRCEVFELASGQRVLTLAEDAASSQAVGYSSSGKTLLTGSGDGRVRFWDAVTGQPEGSLGGHKKAVTALLFIPGTARTYASGSQDGTVRIRIVGSSQQVARLEVGAAVRCLAASPGGRWLAVGDDSGAITIWDSQNWSQAKAFQGHLYADQSSPSGVTSLAFSPQGDLLASGGHSRRVKWWETRGWTEQAQWLAPEAEIRSLVFAPDAPLLVVACQMPTLQVVNYQQQPPSSSYTLGPHGDWPTQLVYAPPAGPLFSASLDGQLRSWPNPL